MSQEDQAAKATENQTAKAIEAITSKAVTDREFRSLILSNPREAVKQATGIDLPEEFKLQVIENDGAHYTLVLPDAAAKGEELTEIELQTVVGGAAIYTHDYVVPVKDDNEYDAIYFCKGPDQQRIAGGTVPKGHPYDADTKIVFTM
ncbi:NHLP leader peptide family RiPP precursor [Cohnella panacarvi]|uniref:NHLP leader peptide family RiPP precursor n=1 Tax=Cohnella panacarvi TaxID=400776 RepID=UPI0004790ABA|nr:NHLP leader peptide family RiPP precursor [Cohnella panacarvi]